jgi:hypothetical protein
MRLLDSKVGIQVPMIPRVLAQTTSAYNPNYYNQFNSYGSPYFATNPSSTAFSTLASTPFGPPYGYQQISPWFPSVPAIACGAGLFSFTVNGVPDKDVNIPLVDDNENEGKDDENNLVSLQIIRDNNNFRINNDDVQGQIATGEKNIERQEWKDFEVKELFNTCRTLAYSSSADVNKNVKTPLPTSVLSDNNHLSPFPTSTFMQQAFQSTDFSSRCPDGYHRSPSGLCEYDINAVGLPRCPDGYHRSPSGICEYDLS